MDHMPETMETGMLWGRFERYARNKLCTIKIIAVAPNGVLSRQYHHRHDELWVAPDAGAETAK
jgi:mannose-6-phosphate isomerase